MEEVKSWRGILKINLLERGHPARLSAKREP